MHEHRAQVAATAGEASPSPSPAASATPAVTVPPGTVVDPIPTSQELPASPGPSAPADSDAHRVGHGSPDALGDFTKAPDLLGEEDERERQALKRFADPTQHVDLMIYRKDSAVAIAEAYGLAVLGSEDQTEAVDGFLHGILTSAKGEFTIDGIDEKDAGSLGGLLKCGTVHRGGATVGHVCVWADDGTIGSVLVLNDATAKVSALTLELRTKVES